MQMNKSPGYDDVGKTRSLHKPLLHIFNLLIEQGILPDKPKTARVISMHKKTEKTDLGNYRPISILPCFLKIWRGTVSKRTFY